MNEMNINNAMEVSLFEVKYKYGWRDGDFGDFGDLNCREKSN